MSKLQKKDAVKSTLIIEIDPTECPFREFKDSELSPDYWGMGPATFRAIIGQGKSATKPSADYVWVDDQTQPLPRSARHYLHRWVRAEELAMNLWEAEVVIAEENNNDKMSVVDTQMSYAQVLLRSSFCRKVLSSCFMLERAEGIMVEHQWENFNFSIPPGDGWRARYHIYSPGLKPGGGQQHRPGLSRNGCYLVRLFYLGVWRCVWVNDQVPVDSNDSPLLPFSPLISMVPAKPGRSQAPITITSQTLNLWPLLLCKALLKLAAPDMISDENVHNTEDETMSNFYILHALTGGVNLTYGSVNDYNEQWKLIIREVPMFMWDDDDDTLTSTMKSKAAKKINAKESTISRRASLVYVIIEDSKDYPPFFLPGITPGHRMSLLVVMARDLPLKKPLPEPDVELWKTYRWIEWARSHGLYGAYDCPRTKYLKVNGLMKLSYAPHLLEVVSNESITMCFREEHTNKPPPSVKKGGKDSGKTSQTNTNNDPSKKLLKEELREWIQYSDIQKLLRRIGILYYPSMYELTTASSAPPVRITKAAPNRALDIQAPKYAPLYLQIDGLENKLKLSLNVLHPRILMNSGISVDFIEPAYILLEKLEWFKDTYLPLAKGYVETSGYNAIEVSFEPGRHFCRLWIHSRLHWSVMLISDSALLLGTRDVVQAAAVKECPWSAKFLTALSTSFNSWIRINRSSINVIHLDRDFYRCYQPDLTWDPEIVGYSKALLHWMFRRALQSLLVKRMIPWEYQSVCAVLRRYFCDPDFGLPDKPPAPRALREIVAADPCDCVMPEIEETDLIEEQLEEVPGEEKNTIDLEKMKRLLQPPMSQIISQVCEIANEEITCGVLKEEREKIIRQHEAATIIQAHWRGTWARKCLTSFAVATPEILKLMMDNAFGNLDALSALMNEFFLLFPGAKYAYSIGSALTGTLGLQQYNGITHITPQCKWIPFFQGVFYCHAPVKVHFDVNSSLQHHTVAVYNNDTKLQLPQSYNAHITFDLSPNAHGYTVMGNATLSNAYGSNHDAHWQLTVFSSIHSAFHLCDNAFDQCKELQLPQSLKLRIDEIFIPNRRNILGGIQLAVTRPEAISFRAAATSSELEILAVLRSNSDEGDMMEISRCSGIGEIYWPYITLEPNSENTLTKPKSNSHTNLIVSKEPTRKMSHKPASAGGKNRSLIKFKDKFVITLEPKIYFIDVIAPTGWPLTLDQWKRVDEVRNVMESKADAVSKKALKETKPTGKEKDMDKEKEIKYTTPAYRIPQPGDAYLELECATALGGGASAKRDNERDVKFATARKMWDSWEPGRNSRGAQIRKDFRAEFLEALPVPPSESEHTLLEECFGEMEGEDQKKLASPTHQGPSPATESGMLEMTVESEEEAKYLEMPEQLNDKFVPLYFVPLCTKEKTEEEPIIENEVTNEKTAYERQRRIELAQERMRELQGFNETHVLERQKNRCRLLESLFVDANWCPELAEVLENRDDAIATETLNRTLSANKKKQESKSKK